MNDVNEDVVPDNNENDPKEAINTPQEVEESNDEKIDEDFPGYPHYPAKDDILDPDKNKGRVDVDVENLSRANRLDPVHLNEIKGAPDVLENDFTQVSSDEEDINSSSEKNDSDITDEDLLYIGAKNSDMDMGEDEELLGRGYTPRTGKDLDVPGAGMNDNNSLADDDEENGYFSLGGDEMEKIEKNDDQNNF